MNLPDPEHQHFSPTTNRFETHTHVHAGPHRHDVLNGRLVTINEPGNYAPKQKKES